MAGSEDLSTEGANHRAWRQMAVVYSAEVAVDVMVRTMAENVGGEGDEGKKNDVLMGWAPDSVHSQLGCRS